MLDEMAGPRKADGRCPQCGYGQSTVRLDPEACELECAHCHGRFHPTAIFSDREILSRFQHLPLEIQETLFAKLGFEKQPAPQTHKPFFYAVVGFYTLAVLIGTVDCIRTGKDVLYCIIALLGIPVLCLVLYTYYKGETKSYYRRRRQQT